MMVGVRSIIAMLAALAVLLVWPAAQADETETAAEEEAFGPKAEEQKRKLGSLMFSETDVRNLLKVMQARAFLDGGRLDNIDLSEYADYGETEILQEIQRRAVQEQEERRAETTLPDFYVSSLIYRSKDDWVVWLRKHLFKPVVFGEGTTPDQAEDLISSQPVAVSEFSELVVLTSDKPAGDRGRMKVADITPDTVTLLYSPDAGAAAFNRFQKRGEETVRLRAFDNRVVKAAIAYNEQQNQFLVSLKTNQTFSINMMRVIEGPTVRNTRNNSSAFAQAEEEPVATPAPTPVGLQDSPEVRAADKLINDMKKLEQFIPQRNPQ